MSDLAEWTCSHVEPLLESDNCTTFDQAYESTFTTDAFARVDNGGQCYTVAGYAEMRKKKSVADDEGYVEEGSGDDVRSVLKKHTKAAAGQWGPLSNGETSS